MSHKNITLSIDVEVLERFDSWRRGNGDLPRGTAIAQLLELAAASGMTHVGYVGPNGETDPFALKAAPSKQELKLALGAAVLRETEAYVGVPQVVVEGEYVHKQDLTEEAVRNREAFLRKEGQNLPPVRTHDPFSQVEEWDSDGVAQDPPQDDVDQRARRKR